MPQYNYPTQNVIHKHARSLKEIGKDLTKTQGFETTTLPKISTEQQLDIVPSSIWVDETGALKYEDQGTIYDLNPLALSGALDQIEQLQQSLAASATGSYNVKDFGAVGKSTDDTAFIVDAKTAAIADGNAAIYFPPGIYVCDPQAINTVGGQVGVLGEGSSRSVLKAKAGATGYMLDFQGSGGSDQGMFVDGVKLDLSAAPGASGVRFTNGDRPRIENTWVQGGTRALRVDGGGGVAYGRRCRFAEQSAAGISLENTSVASHSFHFCEIYKTSGTLAAGVEIFRTVVGDVGFALFRDCYITQAGTGLINAGLSCKPTTAATVVEIQWDGGAFDTITGGPCLDLKNVLVIDVRNAKIRGGTGATSYAVKMEACGNARFTSNLIDNGATYGAFDFYGTNSHVIALGNHVERGTMFNFQSGGGVSGIAYAANRCAQGTLTNDFAKLVNASDYFNAVPGLLVSTEWSGLQYRNFTLYDGAAEVRFLVGAGNPNTNGSVAAPGSLYFNKSGGATATFWVKESGTGGTGWVAK